MNGAAYVGFVTEQDNQAFKEIVLSTSSVLVDGQPDSELRGGYTTRPSSRKWPKRAGAGLSGSRRTTFAPWPRRRGTPTSNA